MQPWLLLVGAFFLGAIPFGFIAGRIKGVDLRTRGSGNIGATNVLRELGKGPGITVLVLDALKGYLPTSLAARHFDATWVVAVGMAAVLGHIYSPFVRFRGGKGVATSLGVLIALSPPIAGATLVVFVLAVALTRWVSLGSLLGAVTQAILFFTLPYPPSYRFFAGVIAGFVIFKHRSNIQRILSGTENRLGAPRKSETELPQSDSNTAAP